MQSSLRSMIGDSKKAFLVFLIKNNVYICIRIHHPFPFRSEIAARRYEDRRRNDRKGGCPKPTGACVKNERKSFTAPKSFVVLWHI